MEIRHPQIYSVKPSSSFLSLFLYFHGKTAPPVAEESTCLVSAGVTLTLLKAQGGGGEEKEGAAV